MMVWKWVERSRKAADKTPTTFGMTQIAVKKLLLAFGSPPRGV
jgi:hypothetical protein